MAGLEKDALGRVCHRDADRRPDTILCLHDRADLFNNAADEDQGRCGRVIPARIAAGQRDGRGTDLDIIRMEIHGVLCGECGAFVVAGRVSCESAPI